MKKWLCGGSDSEVFQQEGLEEKEKKTAKRQTKIMHTYTLKHTNMSETDVGCHARPPTVHNEGHSPFCSGSPTVNTILSHWASFPPPFVPSPLSVPRFSPLHISLSIHFGAKGGPSAREERGR